MKSALINFRVPEKLRTQYKRACKKLYTNMRGPLLKAMDETIKAAGKAEQ